MNIEEALNEFRAEYESSEHWGSDLIISLECAEVISAELDKKDKIINEMAEELADWYMDNRVDDRKIDKQYVINKFTNKAE